RNLLSCRSAAAGPSRRSLRPVRPRSLSPQRCAFCQKRRIQPPNRPRAPSALPCFSEGGHLSVSSGLLKQGSSLIAEPLEVFIGAVLLFDLGRRLVIPAPRPGSVALAPADHGENDPIVGVAPTA